MTTPAILPAPAEVLDLTRWKLTLPIGSPGKPTEFAGADLAKLTPSAWFRVVGPATAPGVAFCAPVNGVTTSGSKNPRSELREMADASGKKAAWSSTKGAHVLTVVEAFTALPDGKPDVVGAQIHDDANDISVFRLEGNTLYVTSGNDDHHAIADNNYRLGARFTAQYIVAGGNIAAYYNGRLVTTIAAPKLTGAYFKCGAYVQANCGVAGVPCSSANVGEVTVYGLQVTHTDVAPGPTLPPTEVPPTTPPPVQVPPVTTPPVITPTPDPAPVPATPGPDPAPTVRDTVVIIRHAEKPIGSTLGINEQGKPDTHSLIPAGWARAGAILGLIAWKVPKPDRIYASKGSTTSMRPLQTIQFLAKVLGLTPVTKFDVEAAVAATVAELKSLHGCTWLSMEHSVIVAVLNAFGITTVKTFPEDRFDVVLVLTRVGSGWTLRVVPQQLMPGDKATAL